MDSSESAVLEVSLDQNTDDSSSGSLDSHSLAPAFQDMDNCPDLIMEQGEDIAVKVDAPLKQMTTMETFVTYRVRCKCARWPTPSHVRRRYNHFKAFYTRLAAAFPFIPIPPLPHTHSAREQLDRYGAGFVAVRTIALDAFLNCIAHHPILSHSEDLRNFVTLTEEEVDKALKPTATGGSFALWGIGNLLSGFGVGSTQEQTARVKDPEFASAGDYLKSLQHKLKVLHALTVKLFKDQYSMAKEMTAIKCVTDAWSTTERGAISTSVCALGLAYSRAGQAPRTTPASSGAKQVPKSSSGADVKAFKALLPHRARYAAAVVEKIGQRDQIHAEYIASNNSSDIHNKLEQASEALRSELSDWRAKNRAEMKAILLEVAERQLEIHRQSLAAWDEAVKWCVKDSNRQEIFETCSKTAVAKLSPAKAKQIPFENCEQNQVIQVEINSENSSRKYSQDSNIEQKLEDSGAPLNDMSNKSDMTNSDVNALGVRSNRMAKTTESDHNKTRETSENSDDFNRLNDPLSCGLDSDSSD